MSKQYNFKNIRALLTEGFTTEELHHLCFDVPGFRPVYYQLTEVTGKTEIVQQLLEYVEQKELVETLLDQAKERNPAKYKKYQPYIRPAIPKQRIQIYLQGDFSSLSDDRKSAPIEAFAAVIGVSSQTIEVYGVYEGSIVFDLGIPSGTVQHLRSLLETNDPQLRRLKVEKVLVEKGSGEIEEWIFKGGKFGLVTSTHPTIASNAQGKSQTVRMAIPAVLTQALDFLFGEAKQILAEIRERRQKMAESDDTATLPISVIENTKEGVLTLEPVNFNTEIEDEIRFLFKLIKIQRKYRRQAEIKINALGGILFVPPPVAFELENAEDEILKYTNRLKKLLERVYEQPIHIGGLE